MFFNKCGWTDSNLWWIQICKKKQKMQLSYLCHLQYQILVTFWFPEFGQHNVKVIKKFHKFSDLKSALICRLTLFGLGFLPTKKTGGGGAKCPLLTWLFQVRWHWNVVRIYYELEFLQMDEKFWWRRVILILWRHHHLNVLQQLKKWGILLNISKTVHLIFTKLISFLGNCA